MLWKETLALWAFTAVKVPLALFARPRVERLDDEGAVIRVPLSWRTKNHLGSMYFGALAVGADLAAGLMAMYAVRQSRRKVSVVFKSSSAEYHRRPEGDVLFTCPDGAAVRELVRKTIETGERQTGPVRVLALIPELNGDEPVASFELALSVKLSAPR